MFAPAPSSLKPRILVVDDEQMIGRTLRRSLAKDHEIVFLDSGSAAIELLESDCCFDLVLCDLMMPQTSGMDLYHWVMEHRAALTPRFVFMTGGSFTERSRAFLHQVKNPQVEKPFDTESLRQLVARQIEMLGPSERNAPEVRALAG
ncbi:MAG: response regulator [Myxococcota bacterium]